MAENGSGNGAAEVENEDEALQVLLDGDIDKVMSGLDRIIEAAPSYEKLFTRWQRQQWTTEDFDFTEDARQWADPDMFTEDERKFLSFGFSEFFIGEDRVTVELLPFALATPDTEAQLFLTTQISDEAKHVVFWDRFYREVFNSDAEGTRASSSTATATSSTRTGRRCSTRSSTRRRAPAQGPDRLRRARSRGHRVHGRDRGHARPERGAVHDQVAEGARLVPRLRRKGSRRSTATSRATSASGSSSSPTRSRRTRRTRRSSSRPCARRCRSPRSSSSRRGSTTRTTSRRPSTTPPRSSSTRRSRSRRSSPRWASTRRSWAPPLDAARPPAARPRPGRPPSGARERILEACLDVLKSEGYAGRHGRQDRRAGGREQGPDLLPLRLEAGGDRGRGAAARRDHHRGGRRLARGRRDAHRGRQRVARRGLEPARARRPPRPRLFRPERGLGGRGRRSQRHAPGQGRIPPGRLRVPARRRGAGGPRPHRGDDGDRRPPRGSAWSGSSEAGRRSSTARGRCSSARASRSSEKAPQRAAASLGQLAALDRGQLVDAALVAAALELGLEPGAEDLLGEPGADDPGADREHVGVVCDRRENRAV